ncbi:MAG: hypothetical protein HY072_03500 [Deltaproteobacteria bacterium]|nr:hypothetical protein [Deltaproteobacteria bacterium]
MKYSIWFLMFFVVSQLVFADHNYPINLPVGVIVKEITCDNGIVINDASFDKKLVTEQFVLAVRGEKFVQFSSPTDDVGVFFWLLELGVLTKSPITVNAEKDSVTYGVPTRVTYSFGFADKTVFLKDSTIIVSEASPETSGDPKSGAVILSNCQISKAALKQGVDRELTARELHNQLRPPAPTVPVQPPVQVQPQIIDLTKNGPLMDELARYLDDCVDGNEQGFRVDNLTYDPACQKVRGEVFLKTCQHIRTPEVKVLHKVLKEARDVVLYGDRIGKQVRFCFNLNNGSECKETPLWRVPLEAEKKCDERVILDIIKRHL